MTSINLTKAHVVCYNLVKRFTEMIAIAATIKDVARLSGLSIATISKYINGITVKEENRKRIEAAIQTLDFKVNEIARGLKTNKTMTVGVLIPSLVNLFSTHIISHIERVLHQHGYSTIICDYSHDAKLENFKFDFLMNKLVDGLIIMPEAIEPERIHKALDKDVPVVLIDRMMDDLACDAVLVDNMGASYEALSSLIEHGHKRIGIITGPRSIYTARERLKGYYRVYEDYYLKLDEALILEGDYEEQSGYELTKIMLGMENRPTALFVTNHEMTLGSVMALNEMGMEIPRELSFIGFDNIEIARIFKPPLTLVIQPIAQIGVHAAQVLLKRLKGDRDGFPSVTRLKTELHGGQSV